MEVICLESAAFFELVERVVQRMKKESEDQKEDKWISSQEAMKLLRITSRTTLLYMRNEGKIRYSQLAKKIILYDRESILDYLEKNATDTF